MSLIILLQFYKYHYQFNGPISDKLILTIIIEYILSSQFVLFLPQFINLFHHFFDTNQQLDTITIYCIINIVYLNNNLSIRLNTLIKPPLPLPLDIL